MASDGCGFAAVFSPFLLSLDVFGDRSFPPLWPILTIYLVWSLWIDNASETGGRPSNFVRSLPFWRYFADYYPATYVFSSSFAIYSVFTLLIGL